MEHRETTVELRTQRDRITGTLRLPREGYRSRLSDYLGAGDRTFVPLTDAEIAPLNGDAPEQQRVVVVAVAHIVLAVPLDDGTDEVAPRE